MSNQCEAPPGNRLSLPLSLCRFIGVHGIPFRLVHYRFSSHISHPYFSYRMQLVRGLVDCMEQREQPLVVKVCLTPLCHAEP